MSYLLLLDNNQKIPLATRSYLIKVLDVLIKQLSDQLTYPSLLQFVGMSFGPIIQQKVKESCFSILDNYLITRDLDVVKKALDRMFENLGDLYPELEETDFQISAEFGLIERIVSQFKDRDLPFHFFAYLSVHALSFTLSNYRISEEDIFYSKKALVQKLQPELLPFVNDRFFHLRVKNPRLKTLLFRDVYVEGEESKKLALVKNLVYRFTDFESNTYKGAIRRTLDEITNLKQMITTIDIEFGKHYNLRLITLLKEKIARVLQDDELNLLLGQAREFILATVVNTILSGLDSLTALQYLPMDINDLIRSNNELFYLRDFLYESKIKVVVGESTNEMILDIETLAGISKAFEDSSKEAAATRGSDAPFKRGELYLEGLLLPSFSVLFYNRYVDFQDERFQRGYRGGLQWLS